MNARKIFKNITIILLLIVFFVSATLLVVHFLDYQKNKELYEESIQEYTDTPAEPDPEESVTELTQEQLSILNTDIDFDALQAVNSEVIGWIIVPNTPITYPVLRGTDNQKYLTHAYDGSYNSLGSIFMDYRSSADFSDSHTIIYGHNTRNKSMFGSLNDFVNQDYFENATYIYVFTPEEAIIYEVFSAYITDAYSDSYQLKFEEEGSYFDFIKKIEAQSLFETTVELENEDQIITLSTCTSSNDKRERIVLHGKRIVY
jgi:sortase B